MLLYPSKISVLSYGAANGFGTSDYHPGFAGSIPVSSIGKYVYPHISFDIHNGRSIVEKGDNPGSRIKRYSRQNSQLRLGILLYILSEFRKGSDAVAARLFGIVESFVGFGNQIF